MFRFDESDPRFLILYTGTEHAVPDDYRSFVARWVQHLERGQPFGVIMVSEPHDHHEDDHEDDRQHEAEITRIINDFRRDYRARTELLNTGFARVFTPEMVRQYWKTDAEWEESRAANNRYARYNWGIPGDMFTGVTAAREWLEMQPSGQPTVQESQSVAPRTSTTGLFYGSSTGVTEYIALEIQTAWADAGLDPIIPVNIGNVKDLQQLLDFDHLILGISTWNIGQLQDDWEIVFPQLDSLDFSHKKVAIFGVGDQYNYPDNFLDAVGILAEKLIERGAEIVGFWNDNHYEFRASLALVDGKFLGLAIDEVNQSNLTKVRVKQWIAQLVNELALQSKSLSASQ